MSERQVFTPREAAALLGRSKSWVVEKLQSGVLPGIRDGSRWLVRRADLVRDGWLEASGRGATRDVGTSEEPGRGSATLPGS